MTPKALCIAVSLLAAPGVALAQVNLDQFKKAAGNG